MENFIQQLIPQDAKNEAKKYIHEREIPLLFECIVTGLLHHRPENPAQFLQDCLDMVKYQPGLVLRWDMFINWSPPSGSKHETTDADDKQDKTDHGGELFMFDED